VTWTEQDWQATLAASELLREDAEAKLALVTEQRDELARQLGIEPEWTEADA